jgi:hypothetical protein
LSSGRPRARPRHATHCTATDCLNPSPCSLFAMLASASDNADAGFPFDECYDTTATGSHLVPSYPYNTDVASVFAFNYRGTPDDSDVVNSNLPSVQVDYLCVQTLCPYRRPMRGPGADRTSGQRRTSGAAGAPRRGKSPAWPTASAWRIPSGGSGSRSASGSRPSRPIP